MKYSKQQLARMFLDWPSVRDSDNLDMVGARVDIINAVAKLEDMTFDQARDGLDTAWDTVRRTSTLGFVAAAVVFAEQLLPVIN